MNQTTKTDFLYWAKVVAYTGIGVTMLFTLYAINSIFIILVGALWLLSGDFKNKFRNLGRDPLFWSYLLLFAINAAGILYSPDRAASMKNTEHKLALFILPLVFCSQGRFEASIKTRVLTYYTIILTAICFFCLVAGWISYTQTNNIEMLFYHDLVKPVNHHAVYFSAFTFISICFLLFENQSVPWLAKRKWLMISWVSFLTAFIVLLSSKLALIVLVVFYLYYIFRKYAAQSKTKLTIAAIGCAVAILLVATVDNPIKRRFTDLANGNMNILTQEKFSPQDYFNGFQLRLLFWRCAYEILNEQDAWLLGVSPGQAQPLLTKKLIALDLRQGDLKVQDYGYIYYNFHNQLLQNSVQSGMLGLIAFLVWWAIMWMKAARRKSALLSSLLLLMTFFFFTDSVLERQYGIVLCTFFPLMMLYANPSGREEEKTTSSPR